MSDRPRLARATASRNLEFDASEMLLLWHLKNNVPAYRNKVFLREMVNFFKWVFKNTTLKISML